MLLFYFYVVDCLNVFILFFIYAFDLTFNVFFYFGGKVTF